MLEFPLILTTTGMEGWRRRGAAATQKVTWNINDRPTRRIVETGVVKYLFDRSLRSTPVAESLVELSAALNTECYFGSGKHEKFETASLAVSEIIENFESLGILTF